MRQPYPEDLTDQVKKKTKTPKPKTQHVSKKNKNNTAAQEESVNDNDDDLEIDEDEEEESSSKKKSGKKSVEEKYEAKVAAATTKPVKESKKARNAPKETKDLIEQQTKHEYGEDVDMEESKIEDLVHESLRKPASNKRKAEAETKEAAASGSTKKAKKATSTKDGGDSDDEDASPDTNKDGTKKSDDPERQARTAFVGNLAVTSMTKGDFKKLKAAFSAFGPVESIRFRSIAFAELLPRKVAFITGKLHPERDVVNAYIVFKSKASVAKAVAALNGQLFLNKHIRVDTVDGAKVRLFFLVLTPLISVQSTDNVFACFLILPVSYFYSIYPTYFSLCLLDNHISHLYHLTMTLTIIPFRTQSIETSTKEERVRWKFGIRRTGGGSLELF